jgi:hypothetical protein
MKNKNQPAQLGFAAWPEALDREALTHFIHLHKPFIGLDPTLYSLHR